MNLSLLPLQATFTPAKSAAPSAALMIVLHGRGDSPEGFGFLPAALALPELSYLMLRAPERYYEGFSWYDHSPHQLPGVLRSRQLLSETFDQLWRQGYSPARTLMFGFSQGCLMTLEFGSRYPHTLAGYIGVSGYALDVDGILRESTLQNRSAPWLITHGTQDPVLSCERTREQMKLLQAGGFNLEYREFAKTHTIDDRLEIPLLREWVSARLR